MLSLTEPEIGDKTLSLKGVEVDRVDQYMHFSGSFDGFDTIMDWLQGTKCSHHSREFVLKTIAFPLSSTPSPSLESLKFVLCGDELTELGRGAAQERSASRVAGELRSEALHSLRLRPTYLFTTEKGYLGSIPGADRSGDSLCVLKGLSIPFLLRRLVGNSFKLVGAAYVSEMVNGDFEVPPQVEEIVLH